MWGRCKPDMMIRPQVVQSFVARIWLERSEGRDPTWRGHVQHIQGSEQAYFQDLSEMSQFLERISGIPGPESRATKPREAPRRAGRRAADASPTKTAK